MDMNVVCGRKVLMDYQIDCGRLKSVSLESDHSPHPEGNQNCKRTQKQGQNICIWDHETRVQFSFAKNLHASVCVCGC